MRVPTSDSRYFVCANPVTIVGRYFFETLQIFWSWSEDLNML